MRKYRYGCQKSTGSVAAAGSVDHNCVSGLAEAKNHDSQEWQEQVDAEYKLLCHLAGRAGAHSVLAQAHALVQAISSSGTVLPALNNDSICALVAYGFVQSVCLSDPEVYEARFIAAKKAQRHNVIRYKCIFVNALNDCTGPILGH